MSDQRAAAADVDVLVGDDAAERHAVLHHGILKEDAVFDLAPLADLDAREEDDTRGEDVFAQYVNPDQCRLVAFDGYFVPQGDGACRSFARGELHRKSGRGRIVGIGDQVGAFQMRGTGDDVGGLYVLEIIFVGTDDRRFARAYRDHVRRGADRVGHVGKTGHFLARKSQTAVGAGIGQFHPGQFLGAENVSTRFFGIDARCGILLRADEEHVHARNGAAERGADRLFRAVEEVPFHVSGCRKVWTAA